jgi:hypothetical protein
MHAKTVNIFTKEAAAGGELDSMGNVPSNDDRVRTTSFVERGRHMALGIVDPKFLSLSYVRSPWELKANFNGTAAVNAEGVTTRPQTEFDLFIYLMIIVFRYVPGIL